MLTQQIHSHQQENSHPDAHPSTQAKTTMGTSAKNTMDTGTSKHNNNTRNNNNTKNDKNEHKNKTKPMTDLFSSDSQNYHCSPTQKSLSTKQQTSLQLPVPPMLLPPAKPPAMDVVATPTTQTK